MLTAVYLVVFLFGISVGKAAVDGFKSGLEL